MVKELAEASHSEHSSSPVTAHASPISDAEVDLSKVSPSSGLWAKSFLAKAGKLKITEDNPCLRRSDRQKMSNNGFKQKTCQDGHCVMCEDPTPTM